MALPLLQIPGGAEIVVLLLVLVFFVVGLAILIGATYWVYTDAQKRGNDNAALWAVLTALGFFIGLIPGIVVVVAYMVVRE